MGEIIAVIIAVACAALVAGVIIKSVINRKKGKSSCGGCDGNCSCCPQCAYTKKTNENKLHEKKR